MATSKNARKSSNEWQQSLEVTSALVLGRPGHNVKFKRLPLCVQLA